MEIIIWFTRGGWVMWPILLCSLAALYIFVERILTFRSAQPPGGAFQLKLRKVLEGRDVRMAQELCIQEKSPVGRIVGAGLEKVHHGPMRVRQAMEDEGREEFTKLERHLGVLASISGIAPMLGFLGTVIGLLVAFQSVSTAVGQPSPVDLADGIWQALITTVFGLIVGIPAAAGYNYLVNQTHAITASFERIARDSLDAIEESMHLSESKPAGEPPLRLRREESIP